MELLDDLQQAYREALERIARGAEARFGVRPTVAREPASHGEIEQAVAALGRAFTPELYTLYRTTNGVAAFSYDIESLERLPAGDQLAREFREDYDLDDELGRLLWGPEPLGETIALSTLNGKDLLIELNGPNVGQLTTFTGKEDSGYRVAAPSLRALLDTWALVAETDLIAPASGNEVMIDTTDWARLRDIVSANGSTLAAVGYIDYIR